MRIVFITQEEPFYLAAQIEYLLSNVVQKAQIVGCVLTSVSPFGKNEGFILKVIRTIKIFGPRFFLRYAMLFVEKRWKRGARVKDVFSKYCVPIIEPEGSINDSRILNHIVQFKPDLIISIAGNQIFRKPLLDLAPKGCLNLHTALLPKYRGLMPSFWVLKNDEKETGVSVFFMDEGIDSGPIVVQKRVNIGNRTQQELIRHTKRIGMDAILEAIDLIEQDKVVLMENRDEDMSYYSFPTRQDVKEFYAKGKRFF
ncbi:MAG: formyltransferase family protein [Gammaproteobacteria bacterium]|nr:formyltransferase family protein [Gammaproteobacteria bacterium]